MDHALSTATTTKWVAESQLLHPKNITLDHNLLLNKFLWNKHSETTLATYDSSLNFTQLEDQRSICLPMNSPHLTLYIKESNLKKDIISNKPTIHIHHMESHTSDQTGSYITTIPTTRLQWLREDSTKTSNTPWSISYNLLPQDFAT